MTIKKLIESSHQKNEVDFKEAFSQILCDKVSSVLSEMKIEVCEDILVSEGVKNGTRFTIKDEHKAEYPQHMHGWLKATSQMYRVPNSPHTMIQLAPDHLGIASIEVPAHHIGRVMKEDEELNELSKGTLNSYAKKAAVAVDRHAFASGHSVAKGDWNNSDHHSRKLMKRHGGLHRALDKLTKEDIEAIDELSKGTLGNYIKKAASSLDDNAFDAGTATFGSPRRRSGNRVAGKRYFGIKMAVDKLTKEEVEEINERVSKEDAQRFLKKHNLHKKEPNELSSDDADRLLDFADHHDIQPTGHMRAKRAKLVHGHLVRLANFFNEDVEKVDEVSKGTLTSYVDKALVDVHNQAYRAGEAGLGSGSRLTKHLIKGIKRQMGIKKAVSKLAKEDVETLDEAAMFHVWDNGGTTADRYTVAHKDDLKHPDRSGNSDMLGMSHNPTDPQGFSQFGSGKAGAHLGKKIPFESLPNHLQNHVKDRYGVQGSSNESVDAPIGEYEIKGLNETFEDHKVDRRSQIGIGSHVRSYDFPGFVDNAYVEGHVTHETPDHYHIHVNKTVWDGKEMPDEVGHEVRAPKHMHSVSKAFGVHPIAAAPSTANHETVNESEVIRMPKFTHRVHYNFAENPLGLASHDFIADDEAHAVRQSKKKIYNIAKTEGGSRDDYKITHVEKLKEETLLEYHNTESHPDLWKTHKLVHKSGKELKKGDKVTDFRGDTHRIVGFELPHHSGSSGRVFTKYGKGHDGYFFPSVVDAEIKKRKAVK